MNTDKLYAESIANEYAPKQASKVVALKKLDRKVKRPALLFAYIFGTVSILTAGTGMCLSLRVIGEGTAMMSLGIALGVIGFVGAGITYPLYKRILQKRREKYAFDVITLAKEITDNET